jgi:hypothetical protein
MNNQNYISVPEQLIDDMNQCIRVLTQIIASQPPESATDAENERLAYANKLMENAKNLMKKAKFGL